MCRHGEGVKISISALFKSENLNKKRVNPTILKFATKQRNYLSNLQKGHLFCDFTKHTHVLDETLVHTLQIVLIDYTKNYYICANYTDDNYTIN